MKVAYIASGLTTSMTFVTNEMESHAKAGWDILPVVSCKKYKFDNLSKEMLRWNELAIFRPSLISQIALLLRETLLHPLRMLKIMIWLFGLLLACPKEFMKGLLELSSLGYFVDRCRKFDPEHIHVHFASRSLTLGIMLGKLMGVPVSCTAHAFDIFTRSPNSLKFRMKCCEFIATISQYNVDFIRDNCGDAIAKLCTIVHCGIDTSKFQLSRDSRNYSKLISIGRLCEKKGFDIAIRVCKELSNRKIDFTYEIIGDGPERQILESLISSLGLSANVRLLGAKANDQIADTLNGSGIFIMPCVRDRNGDMDGIPVAMMEAMASGMPVVTTRLSGIPDLVIDAQNGFLLEERDIQSIADKLEFLIDNQDEINKLGLTAREHVVDQFDIEKNALILRNLIESE